MPGGVGSMKGEKQMIYKRKYISLDNKNQYLIIGRNPKNLFTTSDNLFELVSEKMGEQKEFSLKEYL